VLRYDDEGEICGEHDGRHDRGPDGQHEGDDPGCKVINTARRDHRESCEERQACSDGVQDEQDGKSLQNEVRQVPLVCDGLDGGWINRVPELWSNTLSIVSEQGRLVQRTTI